MKRERRNSEEKEILLEQKLSEKVDKKYQKELKKAEKQKKQQISQQQTRQTMVCLGEMETGYGLCGGRRAVGVFDCLFNCVRHLQQFPFGRG